MIGKVRIQADGPSASLELDGVDISNAVSGATIEMRAGHLPEIALDVIGADAELGFDAAKVTVAERAHDMLVQLGWTPPTVDGHGPSGEGS